MKFVPPHSAGGNPAQVKLGTPQKRFSRPFAPGFLLSICPMASPVLLRPSQRYFPGARLGLVMGLISQKVSIKWV